MRQKDGKWRKVSLKREREGLNWRAEKRGKPEKLK